MMWNERVWQPDYSMKQHSLPVGSENAYQRVRGRDWVVNLSPTFSPFHVFGYSVRSLRMLYSKHGLQPLRFVVGGGRTSLPRGKGLVRGIEYAAAALVTDVANAT